jgi:CubicO group peptidase (beta-lactamase class C family)
MKNFLLSLLLLSVAPAAIAQNNSSKSNSGSSTIKGIEQKIKDVVTTTSLNPTRLITADKNIQSWVDNNWINGGVGLLMRNGKIEYFKAFGYDDLEKKTLMQTDHIFRIASQTKAITSTAVMILFEEGKFLLDEPVSKYLPEFKNMKVIEKYNEKDTTYTTVPAKKEFTIRELLTHTAGFAYPQIGTPMATAIYAKVGATGGIAIEKQTLEENIKLLAKTPLFHQPGEKYLYGMNTDILGYLVEKTSGMSLDAFLRQRIFNPLGMKDTYFNIPVDKQSRLVTLYSSFNGKLIRAPESTTLQGTKIYRDFPNLNFPMYSGGGGLSSTIMDYAIFMQTMLNGGEYNGVRILSRNSVRMMTQNQIGELNNGVNKFGLGFGITTETGSSLLPVNEGSFQWGGMFSTTYWADPKEKIVGLFFTNIYPAAHGDVHDRFKVLMYQAIND